MSKNISIFGENHKQRNLTKIFLILSTILAFAGSYLIADSIECFLNFNPNYCLDVDLTSFITDMFVGVFGISISIFGFIILHRRIENNRRISK